MKKSLYFMAVIVFTALAAFAQSKSGGIQGAVNDSTGQPIVGAYVIASPIGPSGGNTYTAQSTKSGQFDLVQMPAATYMICVQVPGTEYLDPCRWSTPAQVTVAPGQVSAIKSIRLVAGSVVRVRVNDPEKQVAKGNGDVMLGVLGPSSLFHPLNVAGIDDAGRTFEIAVPFDTALRLTISSDRLKLADDKGAALATASTLVPVLQSAGRSSATTLTFNITGRK